MRSRFHTGSAPAVRRVDLLAGPGGKDGPNRLLVVTVAFSEPVANPADLTEAAGWVRVRTGDGVAHSSTEMVAPTSLDKSFKVYGTDPAAWPDAETTVSLYVSRQLQFASGAPLGSDFNLVIDPTKDGLSWPKLVECPSKCGCSAANGPATFATLLTMSMGWRRARYVRRRASSHDHE